MKYVGRTKVGRIKPNPSTELAIIRLPVEMKEKAGKFAHIWRMDEDTILIKFSEGKEVEETPSVHFGVHQAMGNDIEERLRRLEVAVEELRSAMLGRGIGIDNNNIKNNIKKKCSGRDLNPGHGIESPV